MFYELLILMYTLGILDTSMIKPHTDSETCNPQNLI